MAGSAGAEAFDHIKTHMGPGAPFPKASLKHFARDVRNYEARARALAALPSVRPASYGPSSWTLPTPTAAISAARTAWWTCPLPAFCQRRRGGNTLSPSPRASTT